MEKLNREQRNRLVEVVKENLEDSTVRELADQLGCSFGYISDLVNGNIKVPKSQALLICEGLRVHPYYVLNGRRPKYKDWREAFNGKY